jgi:ABC-type polysaccharide/polyol phosphate export permease
MGHYWNSLFARRYLLVTLIKREFRIRYKGSFLGWLWVFGAPLLMLATYTVFVVGVIQSASPARSQLASLPALWMCIGMWQWLTESSNRSLSAFHDNAQLVKRTPVPLFLLPLTNIIVSAVSFAVPLFVSISLMLWLGLGFESVVGALTALASFFPWLVAITFLMSVTGTYMKDARHALPLLLSVGMFLSPVLYDANSTPAALKAVIAFNPLSQSLAGVRASLSGNFHLALPMFWAFWGLGLAAMFASFKFFSARKVDFYDVV